MAAIPGSKAVNEQATHAGGSDIIRPVGTPRSMGILPRQDFEGLARGEDEQEGSGEDLRGALPIGLDAPPLNTDIAIYDIAFQHGSVRGMSTSPYDPRHEELVRRLKAARRRLGITQDDLAEYLGLPQSVISRLEAGQRKVSAVELRDLSGLLGVPMERLVPPRKGPSRNRQDIC